MDSRINPSESISTCFDIDCISQLDFVLIQNPMVNSPFSEIFLLCVKAVLEFSTSMISQTIISDYVILQYLLKSLSSIREIKN